MFGCGKENQLLCSEQLGYHFIRSKFPNLKEFLVTAPGFSLEEGKWRVYGLEDEHKWVDLDWTDVETRTPYYWKTTMARIRSRYENHFCGVSNLRIISGGIWNCPKGSCSKRDQASYELDKWVRNFHNRWCKEAAAESDD